eukprot:TRINITY_DN5592_c0_g2_i1.p1 TRINITY_DN5592_c0_g2~~TRINITY_DN5592_c0_g2_i1.p1  ORF type:complete len:215 (+),score=37.31 TRINITY_DN5592_c0_g2_i1:119-763(+)
MLASTYTMYSVRKTNTGSSNGSGTPSRRRGSSSRRSVQSQGELYQDYERLHSKKIDNYLRKYDVNGDGVIQRSELRLLMEDLNEGDLVSPKDVEHIMITCDTSKTGVINRDEILFAIKLWTEHVEIQEELHEWMETYDVDKSGYLDREQLKALLYDLNGNREVKEQEVDWVMRHGNEEGAGRLGPWELERAITAWRYRMLVKAQKQRSTVCSVL